MFFAATHLDFFCAAAGCSRRAGVDGAGGLLHLPKHILRLTKEVRAYAGTAQADREQRSAVATGGGPEVAAAEPTAASVSFITTEHFTLQGERSQTVSEATGRASMFLASVSGGLVALSLMATAAKIGTAFFALALTVLPTLVFVGLVTFNRVLQNRVEDLIDAQRIARLRGFYFEHAPELEAYLLSVPPERQLLVQGLPEGLWQHFVTIVGMVSVITSVLAGAPAAVLVAALTSSLAGVLAAGGVVAVAVHGVMMRNQNVTWNRLRRRDEEPI